MENSIEQRPSIALTHIQLINLELEGESLVVLSYPIGKSATFEPLTPAEQEILVHVAASCSNEYIAARRRTSARTVANQIAAMFRKLGVGSRRELLAIWTTVEERKKHAK